MLQLILKDFRANWLYQLFSLAILFCISTLFIFLMLKEGQDDPVLVLYFILVLASSSTVSLLFIMLDELYKTDCFFISLPITRTQLIKAKYCNSILQAGLALGVLFIGSQFGIYLEGNIDHHGLGILYNPMLWLTIFSMILVFKSYAYPIYFKFGLSKGIAIHSVIQFVFIAFFSIILIIYNQSWNYFQDGLEWVFSQNKLIVLIVWTVSLLLIMGGSIIVSTKVFKNKDI